MSGAIVGCGRGTELLAVAVHDNGTNVVGSDCTATTDAAPAACAMRALEADRCALLLGSTPTCEEPAAGAAEDACKRAWYERQRCTQLFADAGTSATAPVDEIKRKLLMQAAGANGGLVNAAGVTFGGWQPPEGSSVRYGAHEILGTARAAGIIRKNRSYGVYVNALTPQWICRDVTAVSAMEQLFSAQIAETAFDGNAVITGREFDRGIFVAGPFPPRIAHVAAVGEARANEYVVTGSVLANADARNPWMRHGINPAAIRVEVYVAAGKGNEGMYFLAAQEGVEPVTGNFTLHLPNPLVAQGATLTDPAFVVTYVDTEHGTSAPFSMPSGTSSTADSDGDGLADADEDIDGDGIISPGETDPANPDTDGDGLTDGEERLGIGRIETLIAKGVTFANLDALDPANPDADGDCLPDGLEVGLSKDEAQTAMVAMRNRPRYVISPTCRQILAHHNVLTFENAIPYDLAAPASLDNVAILYDLDPSSVTDPTSRDTDSDGIMDGLEDLNFNGRRDKKESVTILEAQSKRASGLSNRGAMNDHRPLTIDYKGEPVSKPAVNGQWSMVDSRISKAYDYSRPSGGEVSTTCEADQEGWTETDPARSDSDGDGLRDGDEQIVAGDTDELGANESSPLVCDTDDDGVPDGMEVRLGTYPHACDSDGDGLADGIELGIIHPISSTSECRGLQAAGTNYRRPSVLDPLNPDADGDGIPDGVEDLNHNGWVDGSESDPTMDDSDNDGVNDGVESTGDFDGDGLPDFDMRLIANGRECTPPAAIGDLDCDGIPNARDEDADNDGCPDLQEGGWRDSDGNGIPDMYDAGTIGCSASGGGTSLPSVGTGTEGEKKKEESRVPEWALDITRGGDCTLVPSHNTSSQNVLGILLGIPLVIMYVFRRVTRAC